MLKIFKTSMKDKIEKEVSDWLKENENVIVISTNMDNDEDFYYYAILYKEREPEKPIVIVDPEVKPDEPKVE